MKFPILPPPMPKPQPTRNEKIFEYSFYTVLTYEVIGMERWPTFTLQALVGPWTYLILGLAILYWVSLDIKRGWVEDEGQIVDAEEQPKYFAFRAFFLSGLGVILIIGFFVARYGRVVASTP